MKNIQIEWKLCNPTATDEELLQYMTSKYAHFK